MGYFYPIVNWEDAVHKLRSGLKRLFFPPEGSPLWARLLPYAVLGVLTVILLTGGAYTWEYTNSPQFCGASCHTMPPEYTAYLVSPHARIACVDCHIGKGFIATRITRKAGDLKHVTATLFKDYEFPIRADELRPARETCELCHFPEKFSDDSLREIRRHQNDLENSPVSIYLTLKTGGGSRREGLGRGIHWHVENRIQYYAADPEQQEIPYVRVTQPDGSVVEYRDVESDLSPADLDPTQLKEMDCITCHNRITHLVPAPEDTIDQLMARNLVSSDIPEIRRKALQVYGQLFEDTESGVRSIEGLENYYRIYYPNFYAQNRETIAAALEALKSAYRNNVYPEQNSDWTTHPNNIGHKNSPGCFRCHDGKHLDVDSNAIRLECNLCHSIPIAAGPTSFVANLEISRGPEPQSHRNPNWISLHNQVVDQNCQKCHSMEDAGGTSNTSFCSNSACHGSVWTYAGFDAPALRAALQPQLPLSPTPPPLSENELTYTAGIGPLLQQRCGSCHRPNGIQGLDVTTYPGLMKGSQSGPVIIPGDPSSSLLLQKLTAEDPHFSQLSAVELDFLELWIKNGAPQ